MADTNTYTSKQNIKKYITQAKFDAIDKSDVPVGTEYNIVGSIAESDLDSDLQAKVNLTGDGWTTEITGGKVKVKNPMTYNQDFLMNVAWDGTASGTQYQFPVATPVYEGSTLGKAIVPVLGSKTVNGTTYHGLFLQNSYTENNYGSEAYSLITATSNFNCAGMIYILPHSNSSAPSTYLLGTDSLIADAGVVITNASGGRLRIGVGASGSSLMPMPKTLSPYQMLIVPSYDSIGAQWVDIREGKIRANYVEYNTNGYAGFDDAVSNGTIYQALKAPEDGGSGYTRFVLLAPTAPSGTGSTTLRIPNKSGTLATLDDIPTGGGGTTYIAGKNIVIDGTTIKTKDDVTFDTAVVNALTVATTGIFTRGPINRVPSINFGTLAEPLTTTGIYSFANIFTTYNETKTTYNFKIPSVGGYVDIRFPNVTYGNLVAQEQLKTIFGNQSLVGSGNIDLYRHNITISVLSSAEPIAWVYITYISSSNLKVDSLTDLKTLIKELETNSKVSCTGYIIASHETIISIYNENNIVKCEYISPNEKSSILLSECAITDSITTI